jgi:ABC-type phosphate/phosphonate transport system substrate-binding protein
MRRIVFVLLVSLLTLSLPLAADDAKPLKFAAVKSFFHDRAKAFVDVTTTDFKEMLKKTTGLDGELISKYDLPEAVALLEKKQLDMVILHGIEYAWIQKKHPDLEPLLIAVNKHRDEKAYLIVNKNGPVKSVADLRGKTLAMPEGTKLACRMYLQRICRESAKQDPGAFFDKTVKYSSAIEALDDLCRDKVQAAIVDTIDLKFYQEVKEPTFNKNLKVLVESKSFPPAVVLCKKGGLEQNTIAQFRIGLLQAHKSAEGKELLDQWKISTFEEVPKDYIQNLGEVLKTYPAP